jgi:ABC-type glycerol-3-phosphate transport system permease component
MTRLKKFGLWGIIVALGLTLSLLIGLTVSVGTGWVAVFLTCCAAYAEERRKSPRKPYFTDEPHGSVSSFERHS